MYHTNLPTFLFTTYPHEKDGSTHCPICGEPAETLYIDRWGMTVGCNSCVSAKGTRTPPVAAHSTCPEHRKSKKGGVQHAVEERLSL